MQENSIKKIAEVILGVLQKKRKRVLFCITFSDCGEAILLAELKHLLTLYPESHIIVDSSAESIYPNLVKDQDCSPKILWESDQIEQEVFLADFLSVLTFGLPEMRKVSVGIADGRTGHAIMDGILCGKKIVVSDDEYRRKLSTCENRNYGQIFKEAKSATEAFGIVYRPLTQIKEFIEAPDFVEAKQTKEDAGYRQVITLKDLANRELVIRDDALITPAARELLLGKRRGESREDYSTE